MRTIQIDDVHVTYSGRAKVRAVRGVTFSVSEGETVAIVGESGSGKSSIGRVIAGLQGTSSGSVRWLSEEPFAPEGALGEGLKLADRPRVQMVFQHPDQSLDPSWTVRRSISEPLIRLGVAKNRTREIGEELMERVGLPGDFIDRSPRELSGGQAQRVAIARALIASPHIVVLDEPTASLDQTVRARLLGTLRELQAATNVGYLLISHDMSSVRRLSDRVLVMYRGRVVEEGSTSQIMDAPVHPYTVALIDAVPPADPRIAWHPKQFVTEPGLDAESTWTECPVPGPCAEHGTGLQEVAPGHLVACIRDPDDVAAAA